MKIDKKWLRYKRIWRFRDFYFNKVLRRHGIVKYFHIEPVMLHYAHKWVISKQKTNDYIYDILIANNPAMVCRFGNTELQTVVGCLEKEIIGNSEDTQQYIDKWFNRLGRDSGFFPVCDEYLIPFKKCILDSCKDVDILAMWHLNMEDFVIEEYARQADITFLFWLEPWLTKGRPWSAALKGKKVLIIHPFEKTIRSQYAKREYIFPGTEILPEFSLLTLKAVQTIAGEKDERFATWFDALDYMFNESMKMDFDVAIIGCGAYGMPLASRIKQAGKQAIHLGGATQLLFGIKGKRWVEKYPSKIATLFNDAWVYPDESEIPNDAKVVEGGCYWR